MTDIPITEGAAREAIRLGHEMAERIAASELRTRRQTAAMRRALMALRSGRPSLAMEILDLELRRWGER